MGILQDIKISSASFLSRIKDKAISGAQAKKRRQQAEQEEQQRQTEEQRRFAEAQRRFAQQQASQALEKRDSSKIVGVQTYALSEQIVDGKATALQASSREEGISADRLAKDTIRTQEQTKKENPPKKTAAEIAKELFGSVGQHAKDEMTSETAKKLFSASEEYKRPPTERNRERDGGMER